MPFGGNMSQKTKMGMNRQFQAKAPKLKNHNISVELKPIMTAFYAYIEG